MPRISVVMGVYNGERLLPRAIESILSQSFIDFEFIICDDGSTDGTQKVLSNYSKKDSRLIVLKNEVNRGLSYTLNRCINVAKGEFIARMDDDDISISTRFEKQIGFLEKNTEYSLVSSRRIFINEDGTSWGKDSLYGERNKIDVFKGHSFVHPSVMIRRDIILKVGGYNESDSALRTEDYDLWCKIYYYGYKGYVMPDYLIMYNESKLSYKKRRYKHRINLCKLKSYWWKKLNLSIPMYFEVIKPLIIGLIPKKLMIIYREKKYSR